MDHNLSIERLLNSKTFANKEVLKGLLKYIHEESGKGISLKEADIAIGFFKRGAGFVPGEDTIVRVNIYKLRSLLEKYYAEEATADEDVIEIPKGSYSLAVKSKDKAVKTLPKQRGRSEVVRICLAISLVVNISLVLLFLTNNSNKEASYNPVWSSYVQSAQPVYITLGDPFFFRVKNKNSPSGSLIVRDIAINSKEDLEAHKPKDLVKNESEISELNYPYFSRNNLWPLPQLISTFAKASIETRLQTLSESSIDDIKNNNVVFIANINSFGWMNEFMEKTSLRLFTNPRQIRLYQGKDSLVFSVPEYIKGKYEDYAFLVKLPGSNNNIITLMGDFHPSGLRGLSSFIYKKKSIQELEQLSHKKYGHFPEYFEMLVKVTSYNYSDFDTKLIHFKSLE